MERDYEQAVFWLYKAAEQGDVHGQWWLGHMCKSGRGVPLDLEKAIFWYRKAAEQGDATAQENLEELGINWKET